jgi:hypothetical protein
VYVVKAFVGNGGIASLILNLAAGWNGLASSAGRFTSEKETEVPMQQEAGWSSEPFGTLWRRDRLLAPSGICTRSPVAVPNTLPRLLHDTYPISVSRVTKYRMICVGDYGW